MRNPWIDLPASPPYVLPCDRAAVERFNARAKPPVALRLQHLPEPFIGRRDAPVVLLNLNPGFSDDDDEWHGSARFAAALRTNLAHEALDWPLYLLNPAFPTPGQDWWAQKLRWLIAATSAERVARNVLCVEFYGYHSIKCGRRTVWLPSQAYGAHLVRQAMQRDALIVQLRAARAWRTLVPELTSYPRIARLSSSSNVSMSPKNLLPSFDLVVQAIVGERQSAGCTDG